MSRSLFHISEDMGALDALLSEANGDVSAPETQAALETWEAELETDLLGKVDAYCGLITEMEARIWTRTVESRRLKELADFDQRAVDALRDRLRAVWLARNLGKLQCPRFVVSVVKNGGKLPLLVTDSADNLPRWAVKTVTSVSVDNDAIRARIDSGEVLSFAQLGERGVRLSIK